MLAIPHSQYLPLPTAQCLLFLSFFAFFSTTLYTLVSQYVSAQKAIHLHTETARRRSLSNAARRGEKIRFYIDADDDDDDDDQHADNDTNKDNDRRHEHEPRVAKSLVFEDKYRDDIDDMV